MIIKILNAGQTIRRDARRRLWIPTGVPMVIAPDTTLTLFAHRIDDSYLIHYLLRSAGGALVATDRLRVTAWTSLKGVCPHTVAMLPRAVRFDRYPRPAALLMEFVMMDEAASPASSGLK